MQEEKNKKKIIKKAKRQIKVYSKYVTKTGNSISEIRLLGRWIEELGFVSGNSILILCEENKITIVPIETVTQVISDDDKAG